MKNCFIILIFILLIGCSNNKKVYWCGDHQCINKKEKESYFKKTMIVEIKEIPRSNKNKSEFEKIKKQALANQKKRINEEKELAKQIRVDEKRRIKEEKELAKQIRVDEKKRIKGKKKMIKQTRLEEKMKVKKNIFKENLKNQNQDSSQKISIGASAAKIDINLSTFKKIKESIYKRNMSKPYPDITNLPN